jgi:predicted SAM-dependent methyltransferase
MINIIRDTCALCNGILKHIYEIKNVPISFSIIHNIDDECVNSDLSYYYCESCNSIQLNKLIPLDILYKNAHNYNIVGKVWENYFKLFISLLNDNINNKNILEIGCPSGKLALSSDNYNKWFIVEPNIKDELFVNNKNIILIKEFFSNKLKIDDNIDLIVHSHLFEHIYEPRIFLIHCFNILKEKGKMIFSIPNMEYILENNLSLNGGVMFEHNIFYSRSNLVKLLESSGFQILNIIKYENHSIIFETEKSISSSIIKYNIDTYGINVLNTLIENNKIYDKFINSCKNKLLNETRPIYLFGASYNNYLLLINGLNDINIKGILDNCLEKQGKYLYGFKHLIYSPEILKTQNAVVIIKNGYYSNEIISQINNINPNTFILN